MTIFVWALYNFYMIEFSILTEHFKYRFIHTSEAHIDIFMIQYNGIPSENGRNVLHSGLECFYHISQNVVTTEIIPPKYLQRHFWL